jgi:hypothetical protein
MRQQGRLAERADRAPSQAERKSPDSDDSDLLPSLTADERAKLVAQYAKGTRHTGSVVGRRAGGYVISFGKLSALLPFDLVGNSTLGKRVTVTIVEFDGTRVPHCSRKVA